MSDLPGSTQNLRVLGVFAHPDDEVFCAGGTLANYAAAGAEVMVVSATRGQAGQIRSAQIATRHTLGQVREWVVQSEPILRWSLSSEAASASASNVSPA